LPKGSDGVPRISIDDARTEVEQGRAVIFDVRGKDQYDAGHIPGAKVVPVGEVDDRCVSSPRTS
jgi:rhodanese-related sulfurtransferase